MPGKYAVSALDDSRKNFTDGTPYLETEFTGFGHARLTTPLLAGLFVILPRLQDLQDPFAFHLLF